MLKLAGSGFGWLCFCCCLFLLVASLRASQIDDRNHHDLDDTNGHHVDNDDDEDDYDYDYEGEAEDEDYDYRYDPFGCDAKDLCKSFNRSNESLLNPSDMSAIQYWRTACFCDSECGRHGDCCVDAPAAGQPREHHWRCDLLPGYGEYVYAIGYCPLNWKDHQTSNLCEKNIANDDDYSYLLDIPVFSNLTQQVYSNVFCAKCNEDKGLASVAVHLLCPFNMPECSDHLRHGHYIPGQLTWTLDDHLINVTLTLTIDYFADWNTLKRIYHIRRCWPIQDTCPPGRAEDLFAEFCTKNNSYVRTVFPQRSAKFKNIDCALCNDVSPTDIECVADPNPDNEHVPVLPFQSRHPKVGLYYSWNIDFPDPLDDDGLWRFRCAEGDLFHPVYNICVPFLCSKDFVRLRDQCIIVKDTGTKSLSCKMLAINKDDVTLVHHDAIYVSKTRTTYYRGEYEYNDKDSYLVCIPSEPSGPATSHSPISSPLCASSVIFAVLISCVRLSSTNS